MQRHVEKKKLKKEEKHQQTHYSSPRYHQTEGERETQDKKRRYKNEHRIAGRARKKTVKFTQIHTRSVTHVCKLKPKVT